MKGNHVKDRLIILINHYLIYYFLLIITLVILKVIATFAQASIPSVLIISRNVQAKHKIHSRLQAVQIILIPVNIVFNHQLFCRIFRDT